MVVGRCSRGGNAGRPSWLSTIQRMPSSGNGRGKPKNAPAAGHHDVRPILRPAMVRTLTTVSPAAGRTVCLQLEQRLAEEANRGSQSRSQLPVIEQGIRKARGQVAAI